MVAKLKQFLGSLFVVDKEERKKILFLTVCYFLIVAGYTVIRELKYSIFTSIVGKDFLPQARIFSMFALFVPLFIYAKLVDWLRRYQVLCTCTVFFGLVGLICVYLIGDPVIGMPNTNSSWTRIFGWLFYIFCECFQPFVVSVFWAFANSVSDQESAKKNYGLMVAGSKLGGMVGASMAILVLTWSSAALADRVQDVFNHQALLGIASFMCLLVPIFVILLMHKVPGKYLHGYEAVYQVEKERRKHGRGETGFLAGIFMLLRLPYVFGIFGIVFFYELISTVLSFLRVDYAQAGSHSISEMSIFLYKTALLMHFIGFWISLIGTRAIVKWLGEKKALMLVPAVYGVLLFYFMMSYYFMGSYSVTAFVIVSTATQALHYAFSVPLRETLYIPTVKEIKFKSKSWIDTFGSKFGRSASSVVRLAVNVMGKASYFPVHAVFFAIVSGSWLLVAFGLGRRYENAVANNQVIGVEVLPPEELADTPAAKEG